MKCCKYFFLELLKNSLWNTSTDVSPKITEEWTQIKKIAFEQTVLPLIFESINRLPKEMMPPKATLLKIYGTVVKVEQNNKLLYQKQSYFLSQLYVQGLHPVLLKGLGLAQLYPNPLCRQSGDIDIFLCHDEYEKALKIALLQGEINDKDIGNEHTNIKYKDWILELHCSVVGRSLLPSVRRKRKWLDDNIVKNVKSVDGIPVPNDVVNLIFVFNHLYRHFMTSGVGLRQLCDWMLLLHSCAGNIRDYTGELMNLLKSFKLLDAWQKFGYILVRNLGLPREEMPCYNDVDDKIADLILDRIFIEGNFGHSNLSPYLGKNYILRKWYSLSYLMKRNLYLLNIFPRKVLLNVKSPLDSVEQIIGDIKKMFNKYD